MVMWETILVMISAFSAGLLIGINIMDMKHTMEEYDNDRGE